MHVNAARRILYRRKLWDRDRQFALPSRHASGDRDGVAPTIWNCVAVKVTTNVSDRLGLPPEAVYWRQCLRGGRPCCVRCPKTPPQENKDRENTAYRTRHGEFEKGGKTAGASPGHHGQCVGAQGVSLFSNLTSAQNSGLRDRCKSTIQTNSNILYLRQNFLPLLCTVGCRCSKVTTNPVECGCSGK